MNFTIHITLFGVSLTATVILFFATILSLVKSFEGNFGESMDQSVVTLMLGTWFLIAGLYTVVVYFLQ